MVLPGLERPLQALLPNLATSANSLGLLYLEDGRTCVADREEELGVFVEARGTIAPIHCWGFPLSKSRRRRPWVDLRAHETQLCEGVH